MELANRANDDGGGLFPSQEQLSEWTGFSPRTVWTALAELEGKDGCGWIRRERTHRRNGERGVDRIFLQDPTEAFKAREATLKLPLMLPLDGGRANSQVSGGSNSQDLRLGQLASVATQEDKQPTLIEDSKRAEVAEGLRALAADLGKRSA